MSPKPARRTSHSSGRFRARMARGDSDIAAAQRLRALAFRTGTQDRDGFDDRCLHLLVEDSGSGLLVCCARVMMVNDDRDLERCYSAQFYDLSALSGFDGPMAELGRFCIHPDWTDPDILRLAWGKLAGFVDDNNIGMLFGCSSFAGTETETYLDTFAMLRARHLAPRRWLPRKKAPDVFRYAKGRVRRPDMKRALRAMPPLLRSYLMMGGWVSDHAVVDRQMNTLHVFTGLEIDAIPLSRKRLLRAAGAGV